MGALQALLASQFRLPGRLAASAGEREQAGLEAVEGRGELLAIHPGGNQLPQPADRGQGEVGICR